LQPRASKPGASGHRRSGHSVEVKASAGIIREAQIAVVGAEASAMTLPDADSKRHLPAYDFGARKRARTLEPPIMPSPRPPQRALQMALVHVYPSVERHQNNNKRSDSSECADESKTNHQAGLFKLLCYPLRSPVREFFNLRTDLGEPTV